MLNSLLLTTNANETVYFIVSIVFMILMLVCAVAAIILVIMQPGSSDGIDALGGSSETFFGRNKGKSIESKMKKWTVIALIVLCVVAVAFYCVQYPDFWLAVPKS